MEKLQKENLPDISQLITKGWLIEQSPPSDRLDLGLPDSRQRLDNEILEAQVDKLLLQLTTALIKPLRHWRVTESDKPKTLMCYASIMLEKGSPDQPSNKSKTTKVAIGNLEKGSTNQPSNNSKTTKIAIGNTVSEALTATLANEVADELKDPSLVSKIEEQLEALHIEDQLASQVQDLGLQLRRYRHEKSFEPVPGGERWTIHANSPGIKSLPTCVLTALRDLNGVQAKYSKLVNKLEQSQRQLYGDWCQYMRCVYRPLDSGRGKFLDIDEVVNYIKTRSLAKAKHLSNIAGSIHEELESKKAKLKAQIDQFNHELEQAGKKQKEGKSGIPSQPMKYSLQLEPGSRFWQPTDPVVLITGGDVRVSDRHGRDGRNADDGKLHCQIYEISKVTPEDEIREDANSYLESKSDTKFHILTWLEQQQGNQPSNDGISKACIGFRIVNVAEHPWNPLFLEWGIDMYPSESHTPVNPMGYDSNIITENYLLGSQNPDLQPDNLYVNDNPDRLCGRCILGDTPSLVLRERIEEVLRRRLMARLIKLEKIPEGSSLSAYLDDLLQKRASMEPRDAEKRSTFRSLVELWANPEDDAGTYINALINWYKRLDTDIYKQVPRNALQTKPVEPLPTTLAELNALIKWYAERPLKTGSSRAEDPLSIALLAYQKLFDGDDNQDNKLRPRAFLGQALSGFNGEMIQWKLGLSLPIDEPIGLTPYRNFTRSVADAVHKHNAWTAEPTNNFSPIRSGILRLDKLRLIDNFGKITNISCDDRVIVPTPYQRGRAGDVFLPPRLVQPACVKFRWLDVEGASLPKKPTPNTDLQPSTEMTEMVAAEARSPICGWLVPEKLRGQLLVFAGDGSPLGSLAVDKNSNSNTLKWLLAPGFLHFSDDECKAGREWLQSVSAEYYQKVTHDQNAETLRDLDEIGANLQKLQNHRLARVLLYLLATRSPQFLECFLNTMDDAIANIDPEGTISMGSLALLVGRPLAVVGAELDLQLKDEPAVRQDWDAFYMDQYRYERDTDKFERVQFRLRLGQYQSRNDGVVGYWLEDSGRFVQDTFVAQAADDDDPSRRLELNVSETDKKALKAKINAHDNGDQIDDLNFTQSVADPPLHVTLLMDPRGKANLTTGILPVKSIDIPRPLWEPAMAAMQIWFSAAPILSRPYSRRVPIPSLVDRQWSWMEQVRTDNTQIWQTLYPRPSVSRDALQMLFRELNQQLQRKNLSEYSLMVINSQVTESFPNERKSLIIARKFNNADKEYRVWIFDSNKNRTLIDQRLTDSKLVQDLDDALLNPSNYPEQNLVKEILTSLGQPEAVYTLSLRSSQNTESVPNQGKSLVIARKIKNEDKSYLIYIFDNNGNNALIEENLTDSEMVEELDNSLFNPLNCQDRELLKKITKNFGYTDPEIDRLIEKKWLEEIQSNCDRLYVNPKEDRQPLDDWSLETLLDQRLAELSLALVSPEEDVDLSAKIEVREGWLLLQSSNVDRKT